MYTIIQSYQGAPMFADELKRKADAIEKDMGSVPGFIAYYMIKTTNGATSVTVCDDRKGCDECSRRLTSWLKTNLPGLRFSPPQFIEGELAFRFAHYKTAV
ncbi:MAG: hypothetical protein RL760_449 [Candidatus Eisenbacteria bacterium]|jgi:hypothetical protein